MGHHDDRARHLDFPAGHAKTRSSRTLTTLAVLSLLGSILFLFVRATSIMDIPGDPSAQGWIMQDFRDNLYYPVISFLTGNVPYDAPVHLATYPVFQPFPPYSPLLLLVHVPLGLLSYNASQLTYVLLSLVLTLAVAFVTLKIIGVTPSTLSVSTIGTLVLLSRPGHWNLLLGQPTLEFVLAVYLALHLGSKNARVSGIAFALATMKATFAIPLAALMLARRYFRALAIGVGVSVPLTLLPTYVLIRSSGGFLPLMDSIVETVKTFGNSVGNSPVTCPVRIDVVALVSRIVGRNLGVGFEITVLVVLLALAAATVRRVHDPAGERTADVYKISVSCLAILLCTYHQPYSALLLILPITALVLGRWAPPDIVSPIWARPILLVFLAIPMLNFAGSWTVSRMFVSGSVEWKIIVSINSAAILAAFVIYVWLAFKRDLVAFLLHAR